MANRVAWYGRGWVIPTLTVLTLVATLFPEDIREAVTGVVVLEDRLFEVLRMGGLIGLIVVLVLKSDRAARASEDLREQLLEDLSDHRSQLKEDLADHRKQLQEDLTDLINTRLKPISDGVGMLQSNASALSSHMSAFKQSSGRARVEDDCARVENRRAHRHGGPFYKNNLTTALLVG